MTDIVSQFYILQLLLVQCFCQLPHIALRRTLEKVSASGGFKS